MATSHSSTDKTEEPKTLHMQPFDIPESKDVDLSSIVQDLSPTSQSKAVLLLQSLRKKEAVVGEDDKGRPVIQYNDERSRKIWWDASNANMITQPRSDEDVQKKLDSCLELINYLKTNKSPSGVVLDPTHVNPRAGQYRESKEFIKTTDVLGTGNSAGDIVVVKDKKSEKESAQKTIMISVFREDEVRSWVDLNETGIPPTLYCFKLEGNKIHIFMEKIENGVTLRDVIDTHMSDIRTADPSLARPFSLYVFHGLLSAVHTMHQKGWTHKDLHPGNIMLQNSDGIIQTRILDFGLAKPFHSEDGLRGFRSDIVEIVRKFTALYIGQEFDSETDTRKNWKEKVKEMADVFSLTMEDRKEIFCLIDSALKVTSLSEVPNLQKEIAARMDFDSHSLSKRVAKILFAKPDFQAIRPDSSGDKKHGNVIKNEPTKPVDFNDLDAELLKIRQVMGEPVNTNQSSMDVADSGDYDLSSDEYFCAEEIDDTFLDRLRKQTSVGY